MNEVEKENRQGVDWEYLMEVPGKKEEIGNKYETPGFGLAAQLFSCVAKSVMEKMGPEEGEKLLKEAVEFFGKERGRRIAQRVKQEGKPLTFRNWLIYTDIDSTRNFSAEPDIQDGDLVLKVDNCTFYRAAEDWGLGEYAKIYCKYVDYAIHEGYGAGVRLDLKDRSSTGKDHCLFRFSVKE